MVYDLSRKGTQIALTLNVPSTMDQVNSKSMVFRKEKTHIS